ncbi:MAG TPA: hypothetical protein VE755_04880, partial [Myxococcales bacterium]|nr:hypothetical protein [Myxococcales bacterium]
AEDDEAENEMGPRPVPHEMQSAPPGRDPVLQDSVAPLLFPRTLTSFDAIGSGFLGASTRAFDVRGVPPDPQADVGPLHLIQIVNASFAVFAKGGRALLGPIPTRTVFAGFGGACEARGDGDGIVLYDPLADRWLISQLASTRGGERPYHLCIAVSRSGDPTGQWARYDYSFADFHDYPKLGVWPDGYYATYNTFASSSGGEFRGIVYCVFDRLRMLAAEPAAQQCIPIDDSASGLTPADLDGTLPPPPGEPNTATGFVEGALVLYRFHTDWSQPLNSFVERAALPVAPFAEACFASRGTDCIPQPGATAPRLDALGDRMMFRAAYRNLGTRRSLVVNHSVSARSVVGIRWYEISDPGGIPALAQQGTYAPDDAYRWMGSAAIDRAGNIGLGFSLSSSSTLPAIAHTGHLASDAPGEMGQGEAVVATSGGSQFSSLRWGDYSSMSVDPADECTFWYTNEYIPADGVFNWRTRIFSFQLPGCASSAEFAVWPRGGAQAIGRGRTLSVPLDTAALRTGTAESSLTLSVAELPTGVTARIEPQTVAPGETATLTLTAAADAEMGRGQGYAVQALAADGTSASSRGPLDVVDADFAMHLDSDTVPLPAAGTARIRIQTQPLFGPAETVSFAASGLPPALAAHFEPAQVVAGGSANLVISAIPGARPPNVAFTVSATAPSTAHVVLLHLRAQQAPSAETTWPGDGAGAASSPLAPGVQGQGGCGCSAAGGGWEALGLLGLLLAIRQRRGSGRPITSSRRR